ncbi:hypothetical protein [Thermoplasma sp. Kam2015]|uniref:hypothetical protein n=1 Tax=Thermoplasma sp. Kam2015 TaxID=2094122 RepID=UPI00137B16FE|nr:hypothetical protein [Thermoplasma sp. Kam2015]
MLSWDQMEVQSILDAYVFENHPIFLSATDMIVMGSVGYDLPAAEDALRTFMERHEADVCEVGRNPLTLKIYGSFYGRGRR